MRTFWIAAVVWVGLGLSVCLAEGKSAGVLYVLPDRNITADMSANDIATRNSLADWWEKDLINVLTRRGGFEAKLIKDRKEFVPGSGAHLLTVKILMYNPGSKAARMLVGFGAGACSMDIHCELFGNDEKALLAKDDGVGSGRDWRNVARKLNENTLKAVTDTLKK